MSNTPSLLETDIKKLPEAPGVYFFRDKKNDILYIGKATSLKDRVKSYFSPDLMETRGPRLVTMMKRAHRVTYTQTDSVLEALVLEAALIKKYKPEFNTRDKDNKSFNYVVITNEAYPRILIERGRTLPETYSDEDIKYLFGPFVAGRDLQTALKMIRRIFPYRDTCTPYEDLSEKEREKARPCFNAQLGLCPGVCIGDISKREYKKTIQNIRLFFEGKKKRLLSTLKRDMKEASKREDFEKATELRNTIFALEHINDTALLTRDADVEEKYASAENGFRIEAYDVSHTAGKDVIGVMVVVENGEIKKSDYRRFKIRGAEPGDIKALKEVLTRRLNHSEWPFPDVIVIDGGKAQKNVLERVLVNPTNITSDKEAQQRIRSIVPVAVVKDERHRPREILGEREVQKEHETEILLANQEAHRFAVAYHKNLRKKKFFNA